MGIVLHGVASPNVLKVGIMLEECGLPYESRYVALFSGKQFEPEFLAKNPLGKVPVLEDPQLGQPLFESGAILLWLAEREGAFLPHAPAPRAEVIQWLMVQMANIGPMFGQLNHFRMSLALQGDPYATGRYQAASERLYRMLDERLQDREWIAADAYSIADMAIWPWSQYLERHGLDPADYPALVRWRKEIGDRPAVARARKAWIEAFADAGQADVKESTDDQLDRFFGRTAQMPAADFSNLRHR